MRCLEIEKWNFQITLSKRLMRWMSEPTLISMTFSIRLEVPLISPVGRPDHAGPSKCSIGSLFYRLPQFQFEGKARWQAYNTRIIIKQRTSSRMTDLFSKVPFVFTHICWWTKEIGIQSGFLQLVLSPVVKRLLWQDCFWACWIV